MMNLSNPSVPAFSQWPDGQTYVWTEQCLLLDNLVTFFQTPANRDAFAWVSHTFTHENLDNTTYSDVVYEISFNQQHAIEIGLVNAPRWSPYSIVPPQISGLHNGDALRAFKELGLLNAVGDSWRPLLVNRQIRIGRSSRLSKAMDMLDSRYFQDGRQELDLMRTSRLD
jgi:hypothetical protein